MKKKKLVLKSRNRSDTPWTTVELNCVSVNEIRDFPDQETKSIREGRIPSSLSLVQRLHMVPEDEWCPDAPGWNGRLWHRAAPQSPVWSSVTGGVWGREAWPNYSPPV